MNYGLVFILQNTKEANLVMKTTWKMFYQACSVDS